MAKKKKMPSRDDIVAHLYALATGKCNDCVRLVLEDAPPWEELDLSLLSEVKRAKGGAVEIKLLDRLKAMAELSALLAESQSGSENTLLLSLLSEEE